MRKIRVQLRYRTGFVVALLACIAFIAPEAISVALQVEDDAAPARTAGRLHPDIAMGQYGLTLEQFNSHVSKAKMSFDLPTFYLRTAFNICFISIDRPEPVAPAPTCPDFVETPKDPRYFQGLSLLEASLQSYLVHSPGASGDYGQLPDVKVHGLAFGALPYSATLHLSQTSSKGYIEPFESNYGALSQVPSTLAGRRVWPGFGPVPSTADNFYLDVYYKLRGRFDVRVDDVQIDGRKVDVGTKCGTSAPATLLIKPPLGYFDNINTSEAAKPARGTPGSFNIQAETAGFLDGNVVIPSFRGCGTGKSNVDRILTALISGNDNPTSVFVAAGLTSARSVWCTLPVADCTPNQISTQQKMSRLLQAVARGEPRNLIEQLQATIKPSDRILPKIKARSSRRNKH